MKKFTFLLLSLPLIALANDDTFIKPVLGIHVVPDSELSRTNEMKKKDRLELIEQIKNGYIDDDSSYPKYLLNLKYTYKDDINHQKTDIKHNISDIKLAFPFREINFIK